MHFITHVPGWLLIALAVLLRTINQILFKRVAMGSGGENYLYLFFDILFYAAIFTYGLRAVVWQILLIRYPLSYTYPFTSLTFITILLAGAVCFGESITLGNIMGSVVIIAGVMIVSEKHDDSA